MIQQQIKKDLTKVLKRLRISPEKLSLEHPLRQGFGGEPFGSELRTELLSRTAQGKLDHGDYSTNIAMQVKRKGYPTPWDLANKIVNIWRSQGLPEYLAKIEVAKPGFINIWLKTEVFGREIERVLKEKDGFGKSFDPELKTEGLTILKDKKILLEHTSPNPQTTIMLGHLRNNFLGMAMANIFEFLGAKVTRDCVVNDRGTHICKAIWGYLVFGQKKLSLKTSELKNFKKITNQQIKKLIAKVNWCQLIQNYPKGWLLPADLRLKPDHANLVWYVLGARAYELSEKVKKQVEEILLAWEAEDKGIREIWKRILGWSAKGYEQTYKRIGSVHDKVWIESEYYEQGKEIVSWGLKKGVFRKSEGAIVSNLSKYGLPDTVVVKADGTALYITQDLALTRLKTQRFPSDLYIWDIGEEQALYFKQLFAICEQLGLGKRENFFHLSYALINFKGGKKMSTRRGEVIKADEVLDELHQRALEIIKSSNQELRGKMSKNQVEQLAEKVAIGAIKYSLLKFSRDTTIQFDPEESLALEGNSSPYLQYTYARCQSVLKKAQSDKVSKLQFNFATLQLWNSVSSPEEIALLRTIYKFSEVVGEAGENFAPNLICNFLFDLAQKYNLFYNKHPILRSDKPVREARLAITAATAQVLKNGLNLLGISAPERM